VGQSAGGWSTLAAISHVAVFVHPGPPVIW